MNKANKEKLDNLNKIKKQISDRLFVQDKYYLGLILDLILIDDFLLKLISDYYDQKQLNFKKWLKELE